MLACPASRERYETGRWQEDTGLSRREELERHLSIEGSPEPPDGACAVSISSSSSNKCWSSHVHTASLPFCCGASCPSCLLSCLLSQPACPQLCTSWLLSTRVPDASSTPKDCQWAGAKECGKKQKFSDL